MSSVSAYDAYLAAADVLDAAAADVERRGVGVGTANTLRGEAAQMRRDLEGAPEGALDEVDRDHLFAVLDAARAAAAMAAVLETAAGPERADHRAGHRDHVDVEAGRVAGADVATARRRPLTVRRQAAPADPPDMDDETTAWPQALGSFAVEPGTAGLVAEAMRGGHGVLVCALGTRGLDELVGLLASRRQMTRVGWLRHLTAADVAATDEAPLVLIGQPDPDDTVNRLGPDMLVANGAAADRHGAVDVLLRLAPLTVAASVLARPDPATGLFWGVRAVSTASLVP